MCGFNNLQDHVESTRQWEEIDRLEKFKQEKRVVHSHLLYRDNIRSILVHHHEHILCGTTASCQLVYHWNELTTKKFEPDKNTA